MTRRRCSTWVRREGRSRRTSIAAIGVGGALALALSLWPSPARAAGWYWQFAIGPSARWLPSAPRYSLDRVETPLRTVGAGDLAAAGATGWLGAEADLACTIADRWQIPLLGVGVYGPVGSYARVVAASDGSLVELRPSTGLLVDVPLPGLGVRVKERRFLFTAAVRTAIVLTGMDARVANGASFVDAGRVNATVFAVRAEITACRRFDPEARACLFVAPNVYEVGFANGGSLGLRWEWGP